MAIPHRENQQGMLHQWNEPKGLVLFKNNHAARLKASCERLLQDIHGKYPAEFEKSLIDWCIWKHTTCEFVFSSRKKYPAKSNEDLSWGDKYAAQHYSEAAWEILGKTTSKSKLERGLRLDHVWERKGLRKEMLKNGFNRDLIKNFVGCVVIKEEHDELSKKQNIEGWARYNGKVIYKLTDAGFCKCMVVNGELVIIKDESVEI